MTCRAMLPAKPGSIYRIPCGGTLRTYGTEATRHCLICGAAEVLPDCKAYDPAGCGDPRRHSKCNECPEWAETK